MKTPAAEAAGRKKLNICFQCHSRLSGTLPTVRDHKKDSGQARMTEIRNCGRDQRVYNLSNISYEYDSNDVQ